MSVKLVMTVLLHISHQIHANNMKRTLPAIKKVSVTTKLWLAICFSNLRIRAAFFQLTSQANSGLWQSSLYQYSSIIQGEINIIEGRDTVGTNVSSDTILNRPKCNAVRGHVGLGKRDSNLVLFMLQSKEQSAISYAFSFSCQESDQKVNTTFMSVA